MRTGTFQYRTRNLRTGNPGSFDTASQELYDRVMRETLVREAEEANRKQDEAPIREIQHAVLAALRKGKSFATAIMKAVHASTSAAHDS